MIEGGGSDDFANVRRMAYARPDLLQRLVAANTQAVTAYLNEQIAAGADAVMIFDTWGGLLTTDAYRALSLAPMRDVVAGLAPAPDGSAIPSIVFTKGGGAWLAEIAAIGAAAVGLDWTVDMAAARRSRGAMRRAAGQSRSRRAADGSRNGSARSDEDPAMLRARRQDTSSTSGTASCRKRRRTMSQRWSRPCTASPAKPAPVLDCAQSLAGKYGRQAAPVLALRGVDKTSEVIFR